LEEVLTEARRHGGGRNLNPCQRAPYGMIGAASPQKWDGYGLRLVGYASESEPIFTP